MTPNEFRKLALGFPEAIESEHMDHPDFRVGGKIFATLGYPDERHGVVKLTPDEQRRFTRANPKTFQSVKGAWGKRGSTQILLAGAGRDIVREALDLSWHNVAPSRLAKSRLPGRSR